MGFFSRFEDRMEDTVEGAASKISNAPISPVQIAKKAEKEMRRQAMVGAGREYAPTLYTVLVNPEDDQRLFGYYPTLAGEIETRLAATAANNGQVMDGQPLVRFVVDDGLKHGKFDVIAEMVAAPIVGQLRAEEMARYGIASSQAGQPQAYQPQPQPYQAHPQGEPYQPQPYQPQPYRPQPQPQPQPQAWQPQPQYQPDPQPGAYGAVDNGFGNVEGTPANAWEQPVAQAAYGAPQQAEVQPGPASQQPAAQPDFASQQPVQAAQVAQFGAAAQQMPGMQSAQGAQGGGYGYEAFLEPEPVEPPKPVKKPPLPYVPEEEIDRSIDYGEYTFNSEDFEDYRGKVESDDADFSHPSFDYAQSQPNAQQAPSTIAIAGGGQAQGEAPARREVKTRLIDLTYHRPYDLVGTFITMGRDMGNDIVIQDINASRKHAELRLNQQGIWVVTDLSSTNGTLVNGVSVASHPLYPGDVITIGKTDFRFEVSR